MNSADSAGRLERPVTGKGSAQLIAFPGTRGVPGARTVARFSMRDRITALNWSDAVRPLGFTKLVFETAAEADIGSATDHEAGNEIGEFILIYEKGSSWASWGIGCGDSGMTLWRSASGKTMGQFETLGDALSALTAFVTKG